MLCLGLVGALGPAASASHPTQLCLDIGADEYHAVSNDDIVDVMRAYPGATDDGHPPEHQGCVTQQEDPQHTASGTNVDWEITGAGDPDSSDSPETPDRTCTVPEGSGHCTVMPAESGGGQQTVRAWIDFDSNDTTTDGVDLTEGPDEDAQPGTFGEPDITDVALWTWTHGDPPPDMCGPDEVCWGRVTIDYQPRDYQFLGKIRRESGACEEGPVTLWKKRPGRDREVAEALSSDRYWEVVFDHKVRGRFYAKLSKTTTRTFYSDWPEYTCEGDRSPVLRVN